MNQNNNIIGYDSQTGQPIYGSQNTNIQQPTQPRQQQTINSIESINNSKTPKKSRFNYKYNIYCAYSNSDYIVNF